MNKRVDNLYNFYKNRNDEKFENPSNYAKLERYITCLYLNKYIKEGDKVIEIGSGIKAFTPELSNRNIEITAVDIFGKYFSSFPKKQNIKTVIADIINLKSIKNESFDIVFVNGVLSHLFEEKDIKKAISESVRICKKGGFVLFTFLSPTAIIIRYGLINKNLKKCKNLFNDIGYFKSFSEDIYKSYFIDELKKYVKDAGLKHIKDISTDGLFEILKEHSNQLDEEEFEIIKDWQLRVCEKKEMLGLSTHILTITKKT